MSTSVCSCCWPDWSTQIDVDLVVRVVREHERREVGTARHRLAVDRRDDVALADSGGVGRASSARPARSVRRWWRPGGCSRRCRRRGCRGRRCEPCRCRCRPGSGCTTSSALLIGIAKAVVLPDWPKKSSLCAAAVFIPTTLPSVFTSGPPESPGSIGADIWIIPCRVSELPVPSSPAVTFWSSAVTEPGSRRGTAPTAGVADGHDRVTDADVGGVGQAHRLEPRHVVDLDQRDVVDDVVAEHVRGVGRAGVGDLDLDGGGAVDHVVVGEDLARRREDHAGAGGLTLAAAGVDRRVDVDDARVDLRDDRVRGLGAAARTDELPVAGAAGGPGELPLPNGLAFPPLPPFGKSKPPLFEPLPNGRGRAVAVVVRVHRRADRGADAGRREHEHHHRDGGNGAPGRHGRVRRFRRRSPTRGAVVVVPVAAARRGRAVAGRAHARGAHGRGRGWCGRRRPALGGRSPRRGALPARRRRLGRRLRRPRGRRVGLEVRRLERRRRRGGSRPGRTGHAGSRGPRARGRHAGRREDGRIEERRRRDGRGGSGRRRRTRVRARVGGRGSSDADRRVGRSSLPGHGIHRSSSIASEGPVHWRSVQLAR